MKTYAESGQDAGLWSRGSAPPYPAAMADEPDITERVLRRARERLSARIDETGISVTRLARRSGVSKGTIHRLLAEPPPSDVRLGTLAQLAQVLRMDVTALLEPLDGEEVWPAPPKPIVKGAEPAE